MADRARTAIAAASAKVDAANKVGAIGEVPHLQAQAAAALRTAQEDLSRGDQEQAIADANHAAELADTAIGTTQKHRAEDHATAVTAAVSAQQDAAAANARADSAQQAAAAAAADAASARAAPPVIVAQAAPLPPTTTVTTETTKQATSAPKTTVRHVVHHRARSHAVTEKTKTTVTTTPN
jgi:hypothetical protein